MTTEAKVGQNYFARTLVQYHVSQLQVAMNYVILQNSDKTIYRATTTQFRWNNSFAKASAFHILQSPTKNASGVAFLVNKSSNYFHIIGMR